MNINEALQYIHAVCWKGSIPGLSRIDTLLEQVAQGHDVDTGNGRQTMDRTRTAHAQSANAHTHTLERRYGKGSHRTGRADLCRRRDTSRHGRSRPHPSRSLQKITTISFHIHSP